jgi:diguanylate cyclase (GGDEF)-like protein
VEYISPKLAEYILDDLDYHDTGHDLGDLLGKIYEFQFQHRSGKILDFRLRLVRAEPLGLNHVFHLILQEEHVVRENEEFRRILGENLKGNETLDSATGLPDRHSLLKDLEMVQFYSFKHQFSACFAVIELDNVDTILATGGQAACNLVLKEMSQLCKLRLRKGDTVGLMSSRAVGVILMQISPDAARVVLNRLRWSVNSLSLTIENTQSLTVAASISFRMLDDSDPEQQMILCERLLQESRSNPNSSVLLEG